MQETTTTTYTDERHPDYEVRHYGGHYVRLGTLDSNGQWHELDMRSAHFNQDSLTPEQVREMAASFFTDLSNGVEAIQ